MTGRRSQRVAELLKEEVSKIVGGELKDPWIGFVTITGVTVSEDLRRARFLVSVLGNEEARNRSLEGLSRAKGYIRRLIGERVRLRYVPDIGFELDQSPFLGVTGGQDEDKP